MAGLLNAVHDLESETEVFAIELADGIIPEIWEKQRGKNDNSNIRMNSFFID